MTHSGCIMCHPQHCSRCMPASGLRFPHGCGSAVRTGPRRSSGQGTDVLCRRAWHGSDGSGGTAQHQAEGSGTSAARHVVQQQDDRSCGCWGGCQQRQQRSGCGQPQPPAWGHSRPQAPEGCWVICSEPAPQEAYTSLVCTSVLTTLKSEAQAYRMDIYMVRWCSGVFSAPKQNSKSNL
jgi:hypothetical protein